MGEFSERTIIKTNNLGYKTVMWSFAYSDWDEKNQPNLKEAKEKILSKRLLFISFTFDVIFLLLLIHIYLVLIDNYQLLFHRDLLNY